MQEQFAQRVSRCQRHSGNQNSNLSHMTNTMVTERHRQVVKWWMEAVVRLSVRLSSFARPAQSAFEQNEILKPVQ